MAVLPRYIDFRTRFSPGGVDVSGYPAWDATKLAGQLTLPTNPDAFSFPITVTSNLGAADSVTGTDEWHWYLSQRTDDTSLQYLTCTQDDATKSGTVTINATSLGHTVWPITSSDNIYQLFLDVVLYAVKIGTGDIYYGDFTRSLFAKY